MRISWSYIPLGANPQYEVQRRIAGGAWSSLGFTSAKFWDDTTFDFGAAYEYRVRVSSDAAPGLGLPPPPPGADPAEIYALLFASGGPWKAIQATAIQAAATENQTADSRYDPRYSTYVFKDFQFGGGIYRGGLFCGFAPDPARVGRSYLKFALPQVPAGQGLWTGSVNAYHTRSAANGSTTIGCYPVSPAWSAPTLKWSTAPALTTAQDSVTVAYDAANPVSAWKRWVVRNAIAEAMLGDGTLSVALASSSETAGGWAYFAKKEYDASLAPLVLAAYGSPTELMELTLAPDTVTGGQTSTGTLSLTAAAPAGGTVVSLSTSDPVATVPATVTIPAGRYSATFTITTSPVTGATGVYVGATLGDDSAFAFLQVNP